MHFNLRIFFLCIAFDPLGISTLAVALSDQTTPGAIAPFSSNATKRLKPQKNTRLQTASDHANKDAESLDPTAIFLRGYRSFEKKDWLAVLNTFDSPREGSSVLEDYVLYFLGEAFRRAGKLSRAQATLVRLLNHSDSTVWESRAALQLAAVNQSKDKWQASFDYARRAYETARPNGPIQQESLFLMAQSEEKQGKWLNAHHRYQKLRQMAPLSSWAREARDRVRALRTTHASKLALTTPEAYFAEAALALKEADIDSAQDLAQELATRFAADNTTAPSALLHLADIYKRSGQYDLAAEEWRNIVSRYPSHALAKNALYDWAQALWNRDEDSAALALFQRLAANYPDSPIAKDSLYASGRIFQAKKQHKEASSSYEDIRRRFPQNKLAIESLWNQGWMAYEAQEYKEAQRLFIQAAEYETADSHAGRSLYWLARSKEKLDPALDARPLYHEILRQYPNGYYALWAETRLGVRLGPLPLASPGAPTKPLLRPEQQIHFDRFNLLAQLGLFSLARGELERMARDAPNNTSWHKFLVALAVQIGDHTTAFDFAKRINYPPAVRRAYMYPKAFWSTVQAQSKQNGVNPFLVISLIRQESLFNPSAVSHANAYGLMQLLAGTAARFTGGTVNDSTLLTDPETNVRVGTGYLRSLLDQYQGSVILALAAYNAGETPATKWYTRSGDLDADEFVENISYRETRKYVKRVLRNYRMYNRMYEPKETALNLRLP